MEYFQKKADEVEKKQVEDFMPEWVSKANSSYGAFKATERLKGERLQFIKDHPKPSHYKTKKTYQISGREVARAADISAPTLLQTSSYSKHFSEYLEKVNRELSELKEMRITKSKQSRSRGPIAENKNELVNEVRSLKSQLRSLKEKNAIEQVEYAINKLHPNVAELLMIKQNKTKGSVTQLRKK